MCIIFFKFFWSFFHFEQNGVRKWFKKLKKKILYIFSTKPTFLVRHHFRVSKNEKKWLFSTFFRKHEKSCFAQILCKSWLGSFLSSFFEVFFILSRMASESDLKNSRKKISIIFDKTDIFSQTSILSFENRKKVTFFDFFSKTWKVVFCSNFV